jgi:hypothetical protein
VAGATAPAVVELKRRLLKRLQWPTPMVWAPADTHGYACMAACGVQNLELEEERSDFSLSKQMSCQSINCSPDGGWQVPLKQVKISCQAVAIS